MPKISCFLFDKITLLIWELPSLSCVQGLFTLLCFYYCYQLQSRRNDRAALLVRPAPVCISLTFPQASLQVIRRHYDTPYTIPPLFHQTPDPQRISSNPFSLASSGNFQEVNHRFSMASLLLSNTFFISNPTSPSCFWTSNKYVKIKLARKSFPTKKISKPARTAGSYGDSCEIGLTDSLIH